MNHSTLHMNHVFISTADNPADKPLDPLLMFLMAFPAMRFVVVLSCMNVFVGIVVATSIRHFLYKLF